MCAASAILQEYNLPGRLVILGTPAEESGSGKVRLMRRGGSPGGPAVGGGEGAQPAVAPALCPAPCSLAFAGPEGKAATGVPYEIGLVYNLVME